MAEIKNNKITQIFIKSIDNKTLTLILPPIQTLTFQSIKSQIQTLIQFPIHSQTLTLNGKILTDSTPFSHNSLNFQTLTLNYPLLGGKGGFGSLLRGAATKAGQKKTNNFDACRDMSGRRLRHVNAEKRLEEWKLEEEERMLEKKAEAYLKKISKGGKGKRNDDGAEKYVEKYRVDSAKCVEEVESSVRELKEVLLSGKKRKVKGNGVGVDRVDAKKLKIWMGKRKLGESDSDDSSDDEKSDQSDVENEKPSVINTGNQSDTSKDGSFGSASVLESDVDYQSGGPSEGNGSEEEKETITGGISDGTHCGINPPIIGNGAIDPSSDASDFEVKANPMKELSSGAMIEQASGQPDSLVTEFADRFPSTTSFIDQEVSQLATAASEGHVTSASESKYTPQDDGVNGSSNVSDELQPLNFDDFNSAAELEALGLERLKSELQARGLKCGGTLHERSARLFLLKTTPIEKLPKKLLAKK